jgi:hypothetical protein
VGSETLVVTRNHQELSEIRIIHKEDTIGFQGTEVFNETLRKTENLVVELFRGTHINIGGFPKAINLASEDVALKLRLCHFAKGHALVSPDHRIKQLFVHKKTLVLLNLYPSYQKKSSYLAFCTNTQTSEFQAK